LYLAYEQNVNVSAVGTEMVL